MHKIFPCLALVLFLTFIGSVFSADAEENTAAGTYVNDEYFNDGYFEDEYFEDDYSYDDTAQSSDPFKAWNKVWHGINDYALIDVGKPMHKGYSKITTSGIRSGIANFRENLKTPRRMLNALLQAEFAQFFIELGRFIVNTTTSLGFADVAGRNEPLYPYTPENLRFGYTLAKWGVPEGPYFVLPFYGPSTVREAIGTGADAFSNVQDYFIPWYVYTPAEIFLAFNELDKTLLPYEAVTRNAIDPYIAVKNAYLDNLSYITQPKTAPKQ